jgi:hypothetical protein
VLTGDGIALRTPLTAAERGAARHRTKQQASDIKSDFEVRFSSFGSKRKTKMGVDIGNGVL